MKFCVTLLNATVCLFWTCIHKPGGSLDYELVIKPSPSLLLSIGGGEEGNYKRRMERGEFPNWLTNNNYKVIAHGSFESKTQYWEYIRWALISFVFIGWLVVLLSAFQRVLKALNKQLNRD
ncbi:hypothetical protein S4054249_13265 [Pseudoalteromonas luteoviolacea]|uniref:Uncharacterized protein n=1 Tax=Pseudoalteromonas luteoviolacea S4054 TaxID=1129367 RepID=A0A0F6A9N8_9GAMM|nr:hypothetical protein S4054249_13265 [Pseudoalteromonas luteoviolacea]AOT13677.1 hypothetical protein S40542_13235 [Pseudoalteromonas luteoviolacea]AOT18591.1 hypothetical protein S4054_13240 [Pseudoalteromonas luteoviolacea]KKE82907.1 hypothetical protein N479_15975 [Pseudoalteromonas luteoviolacea S4054]KZN72729.1 hypothetical protein N481_01015 [Pseudoalteromonas luteoviolacea S4047-1]